MDFLDINAIDLSIAMIGGIAVYSSHKAYEGLARYNRKADIRKMTMSDISHQAHFLLLLGAQYKKAGDIIRGELVEEDYFRVAPAAIETHNCCRRREYRKVFSKDMVDRLNNIYHLVDSLSKISPVGLVSGYGIEAAGKSGGEVEMIRRVYADKLTRVFDMIESINLQIADTMARYEGESGTKG